MTEVELLPQSSSLAHEPAESAVNQQRRRRYHQLRPRRLRPQRRLATIACTQPMCRGPSNARYAPIERLSTAGPATGPEPLGQCVFVDSWQALGGASGCGFREPGERLFELVEGAMVARDWG